MVQECLLCVALISTFFTVSDAVFGRSIQILRAMQCPDYNNTPVLFKGMTIDRKGSTENGVSGNTVASKTINGPITLTVDIQKCDKDHKNCVHAYKTGNGDEICEKMKKDKNCVMGQLFKMWGLEPACPIQKGSYRFTSDDFKIPKAVENIALAAPFWKMHGLFKMGSEPMLCLYIELCRIDASAKAYTKRG